jgi:hypothetical protein
VEGREACGGKGEGRHDKDWMLSFKSVIEKGGDKEVILSEKRNTTYWLLQVVNRDS